MEHRTCNGMPNQYLLQLIDTLQTNESRKWSQEELGRFSMSSIRPSRHG